MSEPELTDEQIARSHHHPACAAKIRFLQREREALLAETLREQALIDELRANEPLADAATAYVAARLANDAAEPKDWTYHAAELERTWRDLCRASGLYEETEEETR